MRKSAKAFLLVLVALVGSVGLTIGAAFSAAFAFAASVALIVPGTGTHNVDSIPVYRGNGALRYIDPTITTPGDKVCSTGSPTSCNTVGVDYPATFFPLVIFPGWCPGLSCDTWNKSVGTGVLNLTDAVNTQLAADPNEKIVIFGYSQGGAVVSQELVDLNNRTDLTQAQKDQITAVTIGNINNPLGLWSRLSFLPTIPGLDITFGPQLPTDGIKSTNYSFEYDPVGDAPQYWGNPVALLNALAAFEYVHGYYLSPNENGDDPLPYGYTTGANGTLATAIANADHIPYENATFVLIPQQGALPIFQPFVDIAESTGTRALVDPVISLIQPVTKVIINLGYDRTTNPGIPQTLSILPFKLDQNWGKVASDLADATVEGVENVVNGVDVTKPPTTTPAVTSLVDPGSSTAAKVVSKQQPTTTLTEQLPAASSAAKDPVEKKDPAATFKASIAKDIAKNKAATDKFGAKLKAASDKFNSQVKDAVDKVKAAVTKATTPKKDTTDQDKKDTSEKSESKAAA